MVRVSDRELSWRTLDAQYWGVPQRRKRIFLVCHFGTECTEEILFKCESMLGYTPQSGKAREEVTAIIGNCVESAGGTGGAIPYTLKIRSGCEGGGKGALIQNDKSATLATNNDQYLFQPLSGGLILDDQGGQQITVRTDGKVPTLRAETHGNLPCVMEPLPDEPKGVYEMSHADEVIRKSDGDICPTLQARMGTGGNQIPLVCDTTYCIAGNIVDRSDTAGANGVGIKENCSYTLNTMDRHGVAYCIGNGQADNTKLHDRAGALNCMHDQQAVMYSIDRAVFNQGENARYDFEISDSGKTSTLVSKGPSAVCHKIARSFRWVVRRLTPRECERLQGFPDDWTRYGAEGKEIKDTPRYKALGNSIAIPCADRIFKGMIEFERKKNEQKDN